MPIQPMINDGTRDLIISDPKLAELHTLPEDVGRALKRSTELAAWVLARSMEGTIIQFTGTETERKERLEAYKAGIALLQLPES